MNSSERLDLKRLIDEYQCENNTENIRNLKHSVLIRNDIRSIDRLKKEHQEMRQSDQEAFVELCKTATPFLYENYADIFRRVVKDELDMTIMTKLLIVLKLIEDGKVDQHEGAVMFGKYLKELYIDSAVKHADNLDKEHAQDCEPVVVAKSIGWKEYKKMYGTVDKVSQAAV
jgi:hypothetical protein